MPVHHVVSAYQMELLCIRESLYFLSSFPSQQTAVVSDCLLAMQAIQDSKLDLLAMFISDAS